MREIKFRAWEKYGKRMLKVVAINWHIKRVLYKVGKDISEHNNLDELELMQYTGLKDKNGKEIYEGDIVNYLGQGLFKIDMSEFGFFIGINDESKDFDFALDILFERSSNFEIIGNIYENPELLINPQEDYSHTHCWDNPRNPCNIPIEKHKQCCLCEKLSTV